MDKRKLLENNNTHTPVKKQKIKYTKKPEIEVIIAQPLNTIRIHDGLSSLRQLGLWDDWE